MSKLIFLNVPKELQVNRSRIEAEAKKFGEKFQLLESDSVYILIDRKTQAFFCECHILAKDLVESGTIDVPLDPESQPEYRANREAQAFHPAFQQMKEDALNHRMFSNIVCEFNDAYQAEKPIKVIGGQHRHLAIENAFQQGVNEFHGVKIYFGLTKEQRLDVQLISNTNIAVSTDLLDRMFETSKGPELRDWCQRVGLLELGEDFSDKKAKGKPNFCPRCADIHFKLL